MIDECPWQADTQDKVFRAPKGAIAPAAGQEPVRHYYSSKPAFLPTLIAGILYPARLATGVPLDRVVLQQRAPRWTQKPDPDSAYGVKGGARDAQGSGALAGLHLLFQADRGALQCHSVWNAPGSLCSRARPPRGQRVGLAFLSGRRGFRDVSLAVYADPEQSHGRGLQCLLRLYQLFWIWDQDDPSGWRFAVAGFFAAFAAANELPALAFLVLLFGLLLVSFPRQTIRYFLPGALVPIVAFVVAQYAVFGEFKLAYEAFGTDEYLYEGSLWKTPLDLDCVQRASRAVRDLLLPHDTGTPRVFLADADLPFLGPGRGAIARGRRLVSAAAARRAGDAGRGLADNRADRHPPGVLHLEPQGAELRRLDTGTALAVLADPVLAASPARRESNGAKPAAGSAASPCLPWASR